MQLDVTLFGLSFDLALSDLFYEGDFKGEKLTKDELAEAVLEIVKETPKDFLYDIYDNLEYDCFISDQDYAAYTRAWEEDNREEDNREEEPNHFDIWAKAVRDSRSKEKS